MAELVYRHWNDTLNPDQCISVDGNAPGRLHLSHWPGNRTPERFRHDLSTGMALNLAAAPDRAEVLSGITTVTNTHWDTDGLCSVFAVLQPGLALVHGQTLLAAALAGDFGLFTTPEGVKIDLTLTALTRRPDSPVASERFSDELTRRQAQYDFGLELLPRLLANPDLHADWFAQEFWTIQQDLRALREGDAEIERFDALDFAVVTSDLPLHETAVNTATGCDRILTILTDDAGQFRYQLRLTTLSWFDLVSGPPRSRPDWSGLVERLNQQAAEPGGRWSGDDLSGPTPTLTFLDDKEAPAPNRSRPELVKRLMAQFFTSGPYLPAGI
ncbi:MAG: hypothetical protein M5U25_03765 [Planctomycetota bacterium]|nr:hypothetical protein [Planctomycetota bacterium]